VVSGGEFLLGDPVGVGAFPCAGRVVLHPAAGCPIGTRAPLSGTAMKERTVIRLIGTVRAGAVPGSTHPQGVSGIR